MITRFLLLRHGLSTYNVEGRIQGRDDASTLTAAGEAMATRTGATLRGVGLSVILTSPLLRAARTAELVRNALAGAATGAVPAIQRRQGLLEMDLEPWCGFTRQQLIDRYPAEERLWREHPEQLTLQRASGAHYRPVVELYEQAQAFWQAVLRQHRGETALIVAHNGILRCLVLAALNLGPAAFGRLRMDNCGLSVLNFSETAGDAAAGAAPAVQLESLNSGLHLGPGSGDSALPTLRRGLRLLLLRHGETDWNRERRFQGQIDVPLNRAGREQARQAADLLRHTTIHCAYSSAMARPRETAEAVLAHHLGVPLTTSQGLVEIGHGLWEGRLEHEIASAWPELLAAWASRPHEVVMPGPGGESVQEVWERAVAAWRRIVGSLADGETALVVAHDAVNKTILCHVLGLTPADIWSIKQGNGGVTVIDYPNGSDGAAVVSALNLTGHLGGVLDQTAAGAL